VGPLICLPVSCSGQNVVLVLTPVIDCRFMLHNRDLWEYCRSGLVLSDQGMCSLETASSLHSLFHRLMGGSWRKKSPSHEA